MDSILNLRSLLSDKLKFQSILAAFLMIIVSIAETLGIALLVPILTSLVSSKNYVLIFLKDNFEAFELLSKNNFILFSFILIIIIYAFKNLFLLFFLNFRSFFEANCQKYFSNKLFENYLNNSYEFHMSNNSSILLRNITTETDNIKHACNASISLLAEIFILFGIISFLLFFDFKFTIVLLILLSIVAGFFLILIKPKINSWGTKRLDEAGKINKKVTDSLQNIKLIKLWKIEKKFLENFYTSNSNRTEMVRKLSFFNGVPRIFFESILIFGILTFFLFSFFTGKLVSEIFIYLTVYGVCALKIIPSCNIIFNSIISIQFTKPSIEKIISEFDRSPNIINKLGREEILMNFENKLSLQNVSYLYPKTKNSVLEKINIEIFEGEKIGIFGPSGAGKSTFIDLIMGIIKPSSGDILVNDNKLLNHFDYSWRKNIGYIQQNILLFDDTLISNIILNSNNDFNQDKLNIVLKRSKVSTFVSDLPEGLKTNLGERGLKISGGQRQRIGIARALYHDPEILILDESTNQLDAKNEKDIIQDIFKEFKQKTILMISHNYELLKKCDKIIHMDQGKIINIETINEKKNINNN